MSNEITTMTSVEIELSDAELDAVSGGAIAEAQIGILKSESNQLASTFSVTKEGTHSTTLAAQQKDNVFGAKKVAVF